ncbi:unnamed protein product, partial [Soboliphyme baturini]|uniref:CBFD_NFYB_HMF domain-containing protein n=1 Tax=Soboliphyme baturini TaxID=241478 RepID=A0A183JAJ3_9BILA
HKQDRGQDAALAETSANTEWFRYVYTVRIKRVLQKNEEVGKMNTTVPVLIGRAVEFFLEQLLQRAARLALCNNAKTLSPNHFKAEDSTSFRKRLKVENSVSGSTVRHKRSK